MDSLKGQLLVATERLLDPNFRRTVLLMLEHTESGAVGVVLNRPTEATVEDLSEQVLHEPFDWDKPIHIGGPVPGPLIVLHTDSDQADQEVFDGLFSTVDASKIQELLRARVDPSLIVANYAGWGPGQLESEFETDSWYTCPAELEHIFWDAADDLWETIVKRINSSTLTSILHLRDLPSDPSLN